MDLIRFQLDVANNHDENIKAFIAALAQERGNKNLEALGQEFGFATGWWDDLFHGHRVALGKDLNKLLYHTEKTTHLRQLCERHGLSIFSLGGSDHNRHSLIKGHFGLARTVNTVHFVAWPHILLAAAYGETPFARKLMAYIMTMVQVAEADQESREQVGVGLHENVQRQLAHEPDASLYHEATTELKALRELLMEMGYHPTTALIEGVKHAERRTGLDLSTYLNASPLMLDAPPEVHYYKVSVLEKRFGIARQGRQGHHLNLLLENYGMQTRTADGEWSPTELARSKTIHGVPIVKKVLDKEGSWTGWLLTWQADFVATVAQWYHMKQAQQGGV